MEKKPRQYIEITEEDVKKVTLRFLKHYYRFRPRSVDAFISADMRGMGGIVADGYLSFPQDDGQLFIATFEATSANTRHEVQFSVKKESLNWDAAAFALAAVATIRVVTHELGQFVLNDLGPWLWWGGLIAAAFFLALVYKVVARSFRRYRYIHAVEQFKQYHADDQWIAIGDNVFPGTEHVYFKELRRQCIKYGFGLIIIDYHFHPHLYITPAKQDQFKNQRSTVEFVAQNDWLQQIHDNRYVAMLREKLPWLFKTKKAKGPKNRFKGAHYYHMVIMSFCLAALGGVFFRQWEDRLIDYQEQESYTLDRLREIRHKSLEEPMIYIQDSSAIWPFKKNMRPYIGDIWEGEAGRKSQVDRIQKDSQVDVIVNVGDNEFALYDCSRFFNLESKKYLIQEGLYQDLELASKRMYELSAKGFKANTVWAGCFVSDQKGYIVYLDELYNSLKEASLRADQIQESALRNEPIIEFNIKVVYPSSGSTHK